MNKLVFPGIVVNNPTWTGVAPNRVRKTGRKRAAAPAVPTPMASI
jgi:hypothetical protein